ncbi:MAG: YggT family protein [Chloroflexota bacterium]
MAIVVSVILFVRSVLELLVILSVLLSYVMDFYHPVRRFVDAIVEPMLMPIRRVVPLIGMFDISPIILIILIRVISNLIIKLL